MGGRREGKLRDDPPTDQHATDGGLKCCFVADYKSRSFGGPLPPPPLAGDIDFVTISLFNKRPRSKDVHVAQITVHLKELDNGELIEEWFQLSPVSPQMKGDMGSVRVKVNPTRSAAINN